VQGFVSNKTSEAGDESVDPLEPLLYRLFLANSSRWVLFAGVPDTSSKMQ